MIAGCVKTVTDLENFVRALVLRRSRELCSKNPDCHEQGNSTIYINTQNFLVPLVDPKEIDFQTTLSGEPPAHRLLWLLKDWKVVFLDVQQMFDIQTKCPKCNQSMKLALQQPWSRTLRQQTTSSETERLRLVLHQGSCTVLFEVKRKCPACQHTQYDGDGDVLNALPPYMVSKLPWDPAFNILGCDSNDDKAFHRRRIILGKDISEMIKIRVGNGESWTQVKSSVEQTHMSAFDNSDLSWNSAWTVFSCRNDQPCSPPGGEDFDTADMRLRGVLKELVSVGVDHLEADLLKYVNSFEDFIELATHVPDDCPVEVYLAIDGNHTMCKKAGPEGSSMWVVAVASVTKVMAWTWSTGEGGDCLVKLIESLPKNVAVRCVSLDNLQTTSEGTGDRESKIIEACQSRPAQVLAQLRVAILQDVFHPVKEILSLVSQNHECFVEFKDLVKNVGRRLHPGILRTVKDTLINSEKRKDMQGYFYIKEDGVNRKQEYNKLSDKKVGCVFFFCL